MRLIRNLLFVLALCVPALAQIDIVVPDSEASFQVFGRSLAWANHGAGTIQNNWIVSPPAPSQGMCVFVSNKDTAAHVMRLQVYAEGDPSISFYTGYQASWLQVFDTNPNGGTNQSIPASSTASFYVVPASAAHLALVFSASSSTGTADLYVVFANNGSCQGFNAGTAISAISVQGTAQVYPLYDCDQNIKLTVTSGWTGSAGSAILVPDPPAPFHRALLCSVTVSSPAQSAAGVIF